MSAPRVEIPHVVRRANGQAAAGASVYVYARGTTTQRTVYSAATGGGTIAQPLTTDANGRIEGWVDPGQHDIYSTVDGAAYTQPWDASAGALEAWITPTFTGTWANFGSGTMDAKYRKTSEGLVIVEGTIKLGTLGTSAFTLPAGYRPAALLAFATLANNNVLGRVEIATGGTVTPIATAGATNAWYTLNGIVFAAEV